MNSTDFPSIVSPVITAQSRREPKRDVVKKPPPKRQPTSQQAKPSQTRPSTRW